MSSLAEYQRSAVAKFDGNNVAQYKQLNASLEGVMQQYQALVKYAASIPVSETQSNEISGWGVPALGDSLLVTQTFNVPTDKNYVTASAEFDATPGGSGGVNMSGYLTINEVQSGVPGINTGGSAAIFISLGFSFAVTPGTSFTIKYYVTSGGGTALPASANNQANCNSLVTYSWR